MHISDNVLARAKKVFERRADRDKIFVTADGSVFSVENDAIGQANNLKAAGKSSEVVIIRRDAVIAPAAATTATEPAAEPEVKPEITELTSEDIAAQKAANAAAKKAQAVAALDAHRAKIEQLRSEAAALPATTTAAKKRGIETKIANAEAKLPELEAAAASD